MNVLNFRNTFPYGFSRNFHIFYSAPCRVYTLTLHMYLLISMRGTFWLNPRLRTPNCDRFSCRWSFYYIPPMLPPMHNICRNLQYLYPAFCWEYPPTLHMYLLHSLRGTFWFNPRLRTTNCVLYRCRRSFRGAELTFYLTCPVKG